MLLLESHRRGKSLDIALLIARQEAAGTE